MSDGVKRLRMFAGPNGSGKTSIIRRYAREFSADGLFSLYHYINADDLYRSLTGDGVALSEFGIDVTWGQLRDSLLAPRRSGWRSSIRMANAGWTPEAELPNWFLRYVWSPDSLD